MYATFSFSGVFWGKKIDFAVYFIHFAFVTKKNCLLHCILCIQVTWLLLAFCHNQMKMRNLVFLKALRPYDPPTQAILIIVRTVQVCTD